MSKLKDNSLQYKTEIKNNFESLNPDNKGIIEIQKLDDLINIINSKKKNPFLFNFIKSLTVLKKQENEEGISYEEYISYLDNILNDNKSKDGLKNIFNVFCDGDTGNISWITFSLIARELGDNEIAEKLLKKLNQSKLYTKDLNFNEFYELMNNEYEETIKNSNSKNIEISENSENINISNLKINEEVEDYEEKPTYKQRKRMKKIIESDMTNSSKNSVQENDEDIIVEEKSYSNQKEDSNTDNEKSNKRYHRRYRSKKVKNNNNNENIENESNNINNHKSYTKYRKNHFNY